MSTNRLTSVSDSTPLDASRGMHSAVHHLRRKVCCAEKQEYQYTAPLMMLTRHSINTYTEAAFPHHIRVLKSYTFPFTKPIGFLS